MINSSRKLGTFYSLLLLCSLLLFTTSVYAKWNEILCEIKFTGATDVERNAGVWVDGTYMGYANELKGRKKILLIPGEHVLTFRQTGYKDLTQKIALGPGQKENLFVSMEADPQARYPQEAAEVKLSVWPKRAAVFVDDHFAGHVAEFSGIGKCMLLSPGKHRFMITLPGWQPFETEVNLLANQRFVLKTDLFPGDITKDAAPMKE